jgi:uncharacterized membrane protein HdeD (DUF308 family)
MSFSENISKADIRFVLTIVLIVGAILLLISLFILAIPAENQSTANLVVGAYVGWTGASVSYWIGTSKGSADKQDELNKLRSDGK